MKNEAVKFNWWKDKLIELWAQIEWMCVCNSFQLLLWNSVKWLYWQPFSVKHWLVIVIDRLKVSYHQVCSLVSQTSSLCQYTQFKIIRFINEIDVHFVVSLQYSIKVRSFKNSFRSLSLSLWKLRSDSMIRFWYFWMHGMPHSIRKNLLTLWNILVHQSAWHSVEIWTSYENDLAPIQKKEHYRQVMGNETDFMDMGGKSIRLADYRVSHFVYKNHSSV